MSGAKFILEKTGSTEYRFMFVGPNNQILMSSDLYSDRLSCERAIRLVKDNAASPKSYNLKSTPDSLFFYIFRTSEKEVVATSEFFIEESERLGNIDMVKKHAPSAPVEEKR